MSTPATTGSDPATNKISPTEMASSPTPDETNPSPTAVTSTSNDQHEQHEETSFTSLSAELRNKIYHLSLTCSIPITPTQHFRKPKRTYIPFLQSTPVPPSPSLLATCKQLHSESTPILYGSNTFTFTSPASLQLFFKKIRSSVKFLRELAFSYKGKGMHPALSALRTATSLTKLVICWPEYTTQIEVVAALMPLFKAMRKAGRTGELEGIVRFYGDVREIEEGSRSWCWDEVDGTVVSSSERYTESIRRLIKARLEKLDEKAGK